MKSFHSQRPRVSIIIPCFNGAAFVGEAIESALSQSFQPIEIIVIDDGSTDRSQDIVRSFGDLIVLEAGPNKGPAAARNVGLAASRGEYVKFLDADDLLVPGSIERQVNRLSVLKPDEFVIGRSFRLDDLTGDLVPHSLRDRMPGGALPVEELILDAPLSAAPLHRRRLLQNVGGFDEHLLYREDFDLLVRLLIAGARPVFTPEVALFYRNHGSFDRVSRQGLDKIGAMQLRMFQKHISLIETQRRLGSLPDCSAGVALAIWQSGRNLLRAGMKDLALEYFALALRCSPTRHVHGKPLYSILSSVLGPIRTEQLLVRAKGWVQPLPSALNHQVQR